VLSASRLRSLLAVDAVATVLAGLLVAARPGLLVGALDRLGHLRALGTAGRARRTGLAVAAFGATKGLLYAFVLSRTHRN
jgi:hypothetical protein